MQQKDREDHEQLVEACLNAFIAAGTLDMSLDQLAGKVGISKRMLIHYFGGRDDLEERVMARLEERLRARFSASSLPPGISMQAVVMALWDQTTAPESRGVLLLIMDVTRRGWSGSDRAKAFYKEQQRLWVELLLKFLPNAAAAEELLQLFQGALLIFLVTGDREQGRRSLERLVSRNLPPQENKKLLKKKKKK
ncbi:TetR/AcrR family transcriptional regulator [Granulicella arctica]|uniref:AcrR family transcriptional regulator n=1 Tax=Granulicella arctica TaxID=940613 RepID=A0A7Y9PEU6_9BACT|nr:TetR/AcrR family transcriptional regulator [Granulicella arctica]NYF78574.1 AcrR family transcriptional regulator [Granulicella arctica]